MKTYKTTEAIARKFSELLKSELSASDLVDIIEENAEHTNNTCASADYLDANVLMTTAMRSCCVAIDLQSTDGQALWRNAWQLAKENEFYTDENEFRR